MPVAATVVGDLRVLAPLAGGDVTAERRSTAALDRAHHLQLAEAQVAGVGVTPRGPVIAEDVRDLESRTLHRNWRLRRRLLAPGDQRRQPVERAHHLAWWPPARRARSSPTWH